jgi:ABC-type sulfate/molybdate transport systems ATPase subunit
VTSTVRAGEPELPASATGEPGLSVSGLATRVGSFRLEPISLVVAPGRMVVVLGPSGAGKTVLLNTIAGFHPASAGLVRLAGRDIGRLPPEQRRIGMVFQDAALFPHLSVADNVAFGPRARGERDPDRVIELLNRFGIAGLARRSPRTLSGGERQRVGLARALAGRPDLLMLDEPLSALDQPTREELRAVLQSLLHVLDIPVLHVTHDRDEALTLADDLAIVVAGRLRQLDVPAAVIAHPADPEVARLLGWADLGTGCIRQEVATIGRFCIPAAHLTDGPAQIFYRPEDLVLEPAGEHAGPGRYRATVHEVTPTVPLARVKLGPSPELVALVHRQDLVRLDLRPGETVDVILPTASVRMWSSPADPASAPET